MVLGRVWMNRLPLLLEYSYHSPKASAITTLCITGFEIAFHLLLVNLQHLLPDEIGRRHLSLIRDIFTEFIR